MTISSIKDILSAEYLLSLSNLIGNAVQCVHYVASLNSKSPLNWDLLNNPLLGLERKLNQGLNQEVITIFHILLFIIKYAYVDITREKFFYSF